MLTYHETTEAEKYIISGWKYSGEYAIYDLKPYEVQKAQGSALANPRNHFYSFYESTVLVGFINLYEEENEVFFGIGISPVYCGQGFGPQMVGIACGISQSLFPGKPLYLEVRTWNTRAVRCYEKAGFHITGAPIHQATGAGDGVFYRMVQNTLQDEPRPKNEF